VSCHAYTHVDAPVHFLPGDRDIASMPVDQWMGEAAVVDLSHLGENAEVTAADLDRHAGHVRAGDIVLLRTDWPARCPVESERFWKDAPYTGRGACEWLVARGVKRWATTIRPTTASAPPSSRRARASRGRSAPRITSSSRAASP